MGIIIVGLFVVCFLSSRKISSFATIYSTAPYEKVLEERGQKATKSRRSVFETFAIKIKKNLSVPQSVFFSLGPIRCCQAPACFRCLSSKNFFIRNNSTAPYRYEKVLEERGQKATKSRRSVFETFAMTFAMSGTGSSKLSRKFGSAPSGASILSSWKFHAARESLIFPLLGHPR